MAGLSFLDFTDDAAPVFGMPAAPAPAPAPAPASAPAKSQDDASPGFLSFADDDAPVFGMPSAPSSVPAPSAEPAGDDADDQETTTALLGGNRSLTAAQSMLRLGGLDQMSSSDEDEDASPAKAKGRGRGKLAPSVRGGRGRGGAPASRGRGAPPPSPGVKPRGAPSSPKPRGNPPPSPKPRVNPPPSPKPKDISVPPKEEHSRSRSDSAESDVVVVQDDDATLGVFPAPAGEEASQPKRSSVTWGDDTKSHRRDPSITESEADAQRLADEMLKKKHSEGGDMAMSGSKRRIDVSRLRAGREARRQANERRGSEKFDAPGIPTLVYIPVTAPDGSSQLVPITVNLPKSSTPPSSSSSAAAAAMWQPVFSSPHSSSQMSSPASHTEHWALGSDGPMSLPLAAVLAASPAPAPPSVRPDLLLQGVRAAAPTVSEAVPSPMRDALNITGAAMVQPSPVQVVPPSQVPSRPIILSPPPPLVPERFIVFADESIAPPSSTNATADVSSRGVARRLKRRQEHLARLRAQPTLIVDVPPHHHSSPLPETSSSTDSVLPKWALPAAPQTTDAPHSSPALPWTSVRVSSPVQALHAPPPPPPPPQPQRAVLSTPPRTRAGRGDVASSPPRSAASVVTGIESIRKQLAAVSFPQKKPTAPATRLSPSVQVSVTKGDWEAPPPRKHEFSKEMAGVLFTSHEHAGVDVVFAAFELEASPGWDARAISKDTGVPSLTSSPLPPIPGSRPSSLSMPSTATLWAQPLDVAPGGSSVSLSSSELCLCWSLHHKVSSPAAVMDGWIPLRCVSRIGLVEDGALDDALVSVSASGKAIPPRVLADASSLAKSFHCGLLLELDIGGMSNARLTLELWAANDKERQRLSRALVRLRTVAKKAAAATV
jgi:hypothetical protein